MSKFIIAQEGKDYKTPNPIGIIAALVAIYFMLFPVIWLDISVWIYQQVYFPLVGIPKLQRGEFLALDRFRLRGLTIMQRINCLYCGYVNGILAWAKAVGNQTEMYSCAVKHEARKQGQEHQGGFFERENF